MKKLLLAAMAALLLSCSGSDDAPGQNPANACVFEGNAVLTTQAEVDAFAAKNYCTIKGNMDIGTTIGLEKSNITNLQGLQSLNEVTGIVTISFTKNLVSLQGLSNLKVIGNYIKIVGNDGLATLTDLDGLQTIGTEKSGGLWLEENGSLATMDGFENARIMGGVIIRKHTSLHSLSGLQNIKKLNRLEISDCYTLTSLSGLEQLEDCGSVSLSQLYNVKTLQPLHNLKKVYHLYFNNCGLTSLKGLENIRKALSISAYFCSDMVSLEGLENLNVVSYISLYHDDNLISIEALSGLSAVITDPEFNTGLDISYNEKIQSLKGLQNITELEGSIFITNNPQLLDFCALTDVVRSPGFSASLNIFYNAISMSELKLRSGTCDR